MISTISSPNSHRHTSTSWTSESRTIISERNESGTVLLRCTLCTSSSRPRSPESSIAFIAAYSGSKRRMKPTCTSGRPPRRSASTSRSDDSASMVSGFSHRANLPCSRQASTCSSCTNPGDAMTTASTPGSATSSSGSAKTRTPSKPAASAVARSWSGSATATSSAFAMRLATRSAWSAPIMPTPITPTRRGRGSLVHTVIECFLFRSGLGGQASGPQPRRYSSVRVAIGRGTSGAHG